jgi:hypothetical protein
MDAGKTAAQKGRRHCLRSLSRRSAPVAVQVVRTLFEQLRIAMLTRLRFLVHPIDSAVVDYIASRVSRIFKARGWGINAYHLTYFSRNVNNFVFDIGLIAQLMIQRLRIGEVPICSV